MKVTLLELKRNYQETIVFQFSWWYTIIYYVKTFKRPIGIKAVRFPCQDTFSEPQSFLKVSAANRDSSWNHINKEKILMSWNYY